MPLVPAARQHQTPSRFSAASERLHPIETTGHASALATKKAKPKQRLRKGAEGQRGGTATSCVWSSVPPSLGVRNVLLSRLLLLARSRLNLLKSHLPKQRVAAADFNCVRKCSAGDVAVIAKNQSAAVVGR